MAKLQKSVAKRIRELLKLRNKSADKLALELEMSSGYMSEFLAGKKDITLKTLERLADGLEVKARDFFPE